MQSRQERSKISTEGVVLIRAGGRGRVQKRLCIEGNMSTEFHVQANYQASKARKGKERSVSKCAQAYSICDSKIISSLIDLQVRSTGQQPGVTCERSHKTLRFPINRDHSKVDLISIFQTSDFFLESDSLVFCCLVGLHQGQTNSLHIKYGLRLKLRMVFTCLNSNILFIYF